MSLKGSAGQRFFAMGSYKMPDLNCLGLLDHGADLNDSNTERDRLTLSQEPASDVVKSASWSVHKHQLTSLERAPLSLTCGHLCSFRGAGSCLLRSRPQERSAVELLLSLPKEAPGAWTRLPAETRPPTRRAKVRLLGVTGPRGDEALSVAHTRPNEGDRSFPAWS